MGLYKLFIWFIPSQSYHIHITLFRWRLAFGMVNGGSFYWLWSFVFHVIVKYSLLITCYNLFKIRTVLLHWSNELHPEIKSSPHLYNVFLEYFCICWLSHVDFSQSLDQLQLVNIDHRTAFTKYPVWNFFLYP